jgi:tetratricopeptide (TPR) repeat protein
MAAIGEVLAAARRLHTAGKLAEAEPLYRRILAADGRHAEALALLGVLLHQRSQHGEAAGLIERSLALKPNQPTALLNLGSVRRALGEGERAIGHYRAAIAAKPDFAEAHKALGEALLAGGQAVEALAAFRRFAALAPASALAQCRCGQALFALDDGVAAEAAFRAALDLDAMLAEAHSGLADLLRRRGDDRAAGWLWHAVALGRPRAPHFATLGNLYRQRGDLESAEFCFRQAVALAPDSADAQANLGALLHVAGRAGAHAALDRAIALQPDHAEAHASRGLVRLSEGEWAAGWQDYAWRQRSRAARTSRLPWPDWDGAPLGPGGTLVVWGEQGVGDEIMFASMLPDLAARAGRLVLVGDARLAPLVNRSFPAVRFVPYADAKAALAGIVDARRAAAGSLGQWLRRAASDFPAGDGYLAPDPARRDALAQRYRTRAAGRRLVGFSWRSGNAETGAQRSIPLAEWLPLFRRPDCLFVNLQYGDVAAELDAFAHAHGVDLLHDAEIDPLRDLDGFAAQVAALDIVVTADNSTVHMAGALGVPVLALLSAVPDWRWQRSGGQTPWYRSARLLRQASAGQWASVIGEAAAQLGGTAPPAVRVAARPVAVLLNDTSRWYHWGCTGTSTGLRDGIAARGYEVRGVPITRLATLGFTPGDDFDDPAAFAALAAADPDLTDLLAQAKVVVVNGEGSLHGLTPTALRLLYLAWIAKARFGAALHIVNHSCYPDSTGAPPQGRALDLYAKVYRAADHVAVREPLSLAQVRALGVDAVQAFDCLPLFVRDRFAAATPRSDRAVLAGSVLLGGGDSALYRAIVAHLRRHGLAVDILTGANGPPALEEMRFAWQLKKACGDEVSVVEAGSAADWLAVLSGARLLVSGRFHHSIAAASLGTPFVAFGSNTRKVEGLSQILGGEPPLAYDAPGAPAAALERIDRLLAGAAAAPLLERMCALAEGNFAGL